MKYLLYMYVDLSILMSWLQISSFKKDSITIVTYGTAKKKRPCYLVGNLVATNWPIEKALHAIGITKFQLNSPIG